MTSPSALILGNGGGLSRGLPYNAFLLEPFSLLTEAPPDILLSLDRRGIPLSSLKGLFISHTHADHTFGFPFLALMAADQNLAGPFPVAGPAGLDAFLLDLTISGFGPRSSAAAWVRESVDFQLIDPDCPHPSPLNLPGCPPLSPQPTRHSVPTYGYRTAGSRGNSFLYLPDSSWNPSLLEALPKGPCSVLMDMNGEPGDSPPVHTSPEDILREALPQTGPETRFYGTHLRSRRSSPHPRIILTSPGDRIPL